MIIVTAIIIMGIDPYRQTIHWMVDSGRYQTTAFADYEKISGLTEGKNKYFITYNNELSNISVSMFLRKGLSIVPTWGHKKETLAMYSSLCNRCQFISSYEQNIILEKDSYVITYIPEVSPDVVLEFEKKILQGFSTKKIIEIKEGSHNFPLGMHKIQGFTTSITYIN